MTLAEKISRIKRLDKDLIPEAIEDANRCLAIATGITPIKCNDGGSNPNHGNGAQKRLDDYVEATSKVDKLVDELYDLKCEVVAEINRTIHDDKLRRFAKRYYVDLNNQHKIAAETHYDYGTVRNAMTKIREKIFSDTK